MPQAVAHFLIPALLAALFRDYYIKKQDKRKFPLHYVLIAGLGGVLPDLDVAAFWVLYFFGFTVDEVHRGITHTLLFVVIFAVIGIFTRRTHFSSLRKHKLNLGVIFFLLAFGIFTHIALDAAIAGHNIRPLYPFSSQEVNFDLVNYLPYDLRSLAAPTFDAIFLLVWIVYLELKHKISDFI